MVGRFRGQVRRGVTGTAAAALAMVALTASQAPGVAEPAAVGEREGVAPAAGDMSYYTALPPLEVRGAAPVRDEAPPVRGGAVPATVLAAYRNAEEQLRLSAPGCRLPWQLLAAIGQVESAQARGGRVDAGGTTYEPIVGPRLDGRGYALIRDTDGGAYDGDAVYDRAVGPMQFIPSTWAAWGADGNGDGVADPHNVHDAALAAGRYLCAGGRDLGEAADLDRAILAYNRSEEYRRLVLSWYAYFRSGHRVVPDEGGSPAPSRTASGGGRASAAPRPSASAAAQSTPVRTAGPSATPTAAPSASASPSSTAPARTAEPPPSAAPLVTVPELEIPGPVGGPPTGTGALTGNG